MYMGHVSLNVPPRHARHTPLPPHRLHCAAPAPAVRHLCRKHRHSHYPHLAGWRGRTSGDQININSYDIEVYLLAVGLHILLHLGLQDLQGPHRLQHDLVEVSDVELCPELLLREPAQLQQLDLAHLVGGGLARPRDVPRDLRPGHQSEGSIEVTCPITSSNHSSPEALLTAGCVLQHVLQGLLLAPLQGVHASVHHCSINDYP